MSLVSEIEWEACLLEPRPDPEVERRVRAVAGRAASAPYFMDCPWAPEAMASLNACMFTRLRVDHKLADLCGLVVSQDNSCRYCFAVQRVLMQGLGMAPARIEQLEREFRTADLSPRERAALEFVRRVSRSNPLPGEADREILRAAGFEELAIKELACVASLMIFFNRISTLPALQPQRYEALTSRWYTRLALPLGRPFFRRFHRTAQPQPLREDQKHGPFSYLVRALEGLPAAAELRQVLDQMWASPILTRRNKGLIFAVVAHALGCRLSEQEAVRLLLEEGVGDSVVSDVLAHLTSPKLDPVESVVVPFARETIWYEAAPIQRRARQVQDALTNAQFLEFIVVAALANAVSRLGIVVYER